MFSYTVFLMFCGVVVGWNMAAMAYKARAQKEVVREVVRVVVQCRSCNKIRTAVEDAVNSSHERMSSYHVPMITRNGVRRVDWGAMGCAEWTGNEPAIRKKRK